MRPRRCHQRWLAEACHASHRSRRNSSLSLLREPFGRPLGLPDWPGLNWVNSLPVTCFPPVDLGLRLTISVHRIRFTGRSLHRTVDPQLKIVMTVAQTVPVERRSVFLERVGAMLRMLGYGHFTDSDVSDVARLATCGLVHTDPA